MTFIGSMLKGITAGKSMKVISSIATDSYPVGMDISTDGKWLAVTAQGKRGEGGHSVSIFEIVKNED